MGVVAIGIVSSVSEDGVRVVCCRREACGACTQKNDCAVSVVNGLLSKDVSVTVPYPDDMSVVCGQLVGVEVHERVLVSSILSLIVLPLVFLVLGTFLGSLLDHENGELFAVTGAVLGLCFGLLFGRFVSGRYIGTPRYRLRPYRSVGSR